MRGEGEGGKEREKERDRREGERGGEEGGGWVAVRCEDGARLTQGDLPSSLSSLWLQYKKQKAENRLFWEFTERESSSIFNLYNKDVQRVYMNSSLDT